MFKAFSVQLHNYNSKDSYCMSFQLRQQNWALEFYFLESVFSFFFFFCKYQQSIINDLYQRLNIKAVQLTLEETQRPLSLTPDSYCCGPVSTTWSRTRDTLLPCSLKQHYITGGFNPQSDVSLVLTYSCTTSPECLDFCLNIVEET